MDDTERTLEGTIVRIEDSEDPAGPWPHKMAVQFDSDSPELEQLLESAASHNPKV